MQRTLTHYEQLKVARDATPEQIKQAYRRLAQQLHPDRNPAPDASDRMGILNASHDVLADAQKRAAYDAQLAYEEQRAQEAYLRSRQLQTAGARAASAYAAAAPATRPAQPRAAQANAAPQSPGPSSRASRRKRRRSVLRWALVFMIFCGAGVWMGYDPNAGKAYVPTESLPVAHTWVKPAPVHAPAEAPIGNPIKLVDPAQPECVIPDLDPMGAPWPQKAGYLKDMPLRKDNGWSQIIIDNTGGESAVYAKVTDAVGRNAFRHAFIPAGAVFAFSKMDAGLYLLKYKMLNTGCAFASNRILLEETPMGSQVKSSVYKLTLRKLQNRNSQFSNLKNDQF
ncbi:J domain-containing protein [Pseudomonas cichorii]|uniref:DnaJ domain protein n=1 Tax=Pseudomonas cichorii TaxID=36746 RepID=A0A3M4VLW9_PSECI|nr:DnaJ domain-containing protein [Pseudomonas cichorii]AHF70172.1 DnaJ domain protein [Pseudomonas cichorii JBC1]QVE17051.1 DnaJ domain-containing protein [Pseudomonas cichorii]RMR52841.1 DnaJ domain protein [Pseudomonas cichorii]SDO80943.1 DnaJ domain-containing protein [Pseudomonas cichorii]GFM93876.1 molecular chaperone DnaJ [Pseudomonas cichorii]